MIAHDHLWQDIRKHKLFIEIVASIFIVVGGTGHNAWGYKVVASIGYRVRMTARPSMVGKSFARSNSNIPSSVSNSMRFARGTCKIMIFCRRDLVQRWTYIIGTSCSRASKSILVKKSLALGPPRLRRNIGRKPPEGLCHIATRCGEYRPRPTAAGRLYTAEAPIRVGQEKLAGKGYRSEETNETRQVE